MSLRKEDPIDRLSGLPDSVLYHILSFLDTKQAVQTSVLSRAWKHLWKHVPALIFDYNCFDWQYDRFSTFVDMVLSLRCPTDVVDKIVLTNLVHFEEDEVDPFAARVFEYAMSHKTRHLVLFLFNQGSGVCWLFPQSNGSISNCNLEALFLASLRINDRFESFDFPRLTTLELISCRFEYDPLSKFPCLKNLSIRSNNLKGKLKRLRIAGLHLHSLDLQGLVLSEIEIFAPNLKSFIVSECEELLRFSEPAFPTLEHGTFDMGTGDYDILPKETAVLLLQAFRNVKSLTVGKFTNKLLCEDFEFLEQQPSSFTRLETLNLDCWPEESKKIPYKLVNYFLKGSLCPSPNIELVRLY
ncbi:F-box/FBD/LRR-repeat protein At4g00160 [Linum perenne]